MTGVKERKNCDSFVNLNTGDGKKVEVNINFEDISRQAATRSGRLGAYAKKMNLDKL